MKPKRRGILAPSDSALVQRHELPPFSPNVFLSALRFINQVIEPRGRVRIDRSPDGVPSPAVVVPIHWPPFWNHPPTPNCRRRE